MASANIVITDSMRVSSVNTSAALLGTLSYVSNYNVSTVVTQELVMLTTTASDTVISLPQLSSIQIFQLQATETVRVNFGGTFACQFSAASAGIPLTFLAFAGSNISGPTSIHLAYSGANSSTVRILMAQ